MIPCAGEGKGWSPGQGFPIGSPQSCGLPCALQTAFVHNFHLQMPPFLGHFVPRKCEVT